MIRHAVLALFPILALAPVTGRAQADEPSGVGTREGVLLAANGPYRANNDLLSYQLNLRVDPDRKFLKGMNSVRFRMLEDGNRIQLDLDPSLHVDNIEWDGRPLKYSREFNAVFIDFPSTLKRGREYTVDFYYSGTPATKGRFGGITFEKDPAGRPWVTTADEDVGCNSWWPCKDQWRDEPQDGMELRIEVPDGLMDVSNGRFEGKQDLGDGYTRWDWRVHYPINSYDVALNIGNYEHWDDKLGDLTLDFYALPEDVAKAKPQFAQAREMLKAYDHYFGPYPFMRDGYKLVQVPYAGMEHQSAVAYGNGFRNGYYGHDWTGVGISPRFDFIIIHESGHEYFGNSITAKDRCDMWIHEGWTTYVESLYVEYRWGKADALRYLNGYRSHVSNQHPIIPPCGTNEEPPQDMYFKGALMINTAQRRG